MSISIRTKLVLVSTSLLLCLSGCDPHRLSNLPSSPIPTNTTEASIIVYPPPGESSKTSLPSDTPASSPAPASSVTPTELPNAMPVFGVEIHSMAPLYIQLLTRANIRFVRRNAYLWSYVEGEESLRNWENMGGLEQELITASENGIQTILIVRSTPAWAQKVRGSLCGPAKREKLGSFASFMRDLVSRLSQPPYNVKYWELGNEPDHTPSQVSPDNVFDCWADQDDRYFGGRYYAEMLSKVYPAIKSTDPTAQVLIGGLSLICDPGQAPAIQDCASALFFKGILENGGGDYFDIVSYHGLSYYNSGNNPADSTVHWQARGGIVVGKYLYIKEVMQSYNIDKPVWLTEASLFCHENNLQDCFPPVDDFSEAQAAYAVMLLVNNWAIGIDATVWYDLEGNWRYGALLDRSHNPKPVYSAIQFLIQELSQAVYVGPVEDFPELIGYEFRSTEKRVWVLWSRDVNAISVLLPAETTRVLDKYGGVLNPMAGKITVSQPIYVELIP